MTETKQGKATDRKATEAVNTIRIYCKNNDIHDCVFNCAIQFLLGVVFQCNWHTAVYTVQLDQLCSLICEISCRTAAFTVDKCLFQILQVRLLAAFFTAVITKLMFVTKGLCLTTVFTTDM